MSKTVHWNNLLTRRLVYLATLLLAGMCYDARIHVLKRVSSTDRVD
jgi:hypothetical protein